MKQIEISNLKFLVPDEMEVKNQFQLFSTLNYPYSKGTIDKPKVIISIRKIQDYDEYDGNDLFEKFRTSILESRFEAKESSFEEQIKNGKQIYILHSFTKTTFQKIDYDFVYFDALIILDGIYCIDFLVIYEKVDEEDFKIIYSEILKSLEWTENFEDYAAYFNEMYEKKETFSNTITKDNDIWVKPLLPFQIPSNGKDIFEIGEFTFDYIEDESSVEISSFTKELYVTLVAKTKAYKKAEKVLLLDSNEYANQSEKGKVKISFPITEIYNNGIPTGSFDYKDDKCEKPYSTINHNGFEYTLDFHGNITFQDNWLGMNGYMKASYNDQPVFDVCIYKKINSTKLDWKNYSFKSLQEALQAPKELVQWLEIKQTILDTFPDEIYEFKNLKSLWITSANWDEKLKLNFISDKIGALKELEVLHITNSNLKEIPESIENLKKLTSINFSNCELKRIPNSVFQLPKLQYLFLNNDKIEELPEQVNLPEFYSIDIKNNLLKTIPATLMQQPKINSIRLTDNVLEYLPDVYNNFKGLELSIEEKKRLLDYDYKGADNKGITKWDNAMYFCSEKDAILDFLNQIISQNELDKYKKELLSLAKKAIGFEHTVEEDYAIVGNHRFGGKPDLPLAIEYPTFLYNYEGEHTYKYEFIGQINCEQIADLQDYLPRTGMLFFFIESIHMIYGANKNSCKVLYFENNDSLVSGNRFEFKESDYYEMFELYRGFKVSASLQVSVPSFYAIQTNSYLLKEDSVLKEIDDYYETLYETFEEPIQDNFPHSYAINSYGFTQHESPELQASLNLKGNPEDWIILLKVKSAGDMQWGDAGDLFFVIHKSDLAKKDFSNVYITMESS